MLKRVINKKDMTLKGAPAPIVKPDIHKLHRRITKHGHVRLTWLGHSGWLVQLANHNFIIDPMMTNVSGVIRNHARFEADIKQLPKIDATIITHDHYDHLNKRLVKKIGARIITGFDISRDLSFTKLPCTELKWWESLMMEDIKITFVPSQHGARRSMLDRNSRLWGGFIFEAPGVCLYHAGDTAYYDGFRRIQEKFKNIQIALMPIGAYGPEKSRAENHLTPEQAIKAFKDLRAKYFLPMHWGTFKLTDEPLDEPPQRLTAEWDQKKLSSNKLKFFAVGESRTFKF